MYVEKKPPTATLLISSHRLRIEILPSTLLTINANHGGSGRTKLLWEAIMYLFEIVSDRNEITKIIIDSRSMIDSDSLESRQES